MSPKLKPLLLPQIVQDRKRRESLMEFEMDFSASYYTQNSSASEISSPATPTFSNHGHFRYPSSTSSIESSFQNSAFESPSSPTFVKAGKRSLPDVQEEPQERDEDFEMFDDEIELYDCLCDDKQCLHRDSSLVQSSVQLSTKQEFDYDLNDGFFSDSEFATSPRYKRRRPVESPLTGLANRFGTQFPSFSRKWRTRNRASSVTITADTARDNAASRGASSRSSSMSNLARQTLDREIECQLPPSPAQSVYGCEEGLAAASAIDIEGTNESIDEPDVRYATTPLLPPLMMDASANSRHVSIQSPLQSPSVAEATDPFSVPVTPIDAITTPSLPGMPSPPLSTKPSISSFHRNTTNRPGHLVPSSEIPPILIAAPDDEWSQKLGHANYVIYPEPYVPEIFDLEACRQLRANWDLARVNYTKHLVRTGEHYGATSKAYKLTEEKWAATDAIWRKNNDLTINNTAESGSDPFATLKHNKVGDSSANIMTKIPSLNDPRSGGKFPQLGDEDIVGPMVQVAAQFQRSPSKKAKLFKFLTEKFPVGLGKP